MLPCYLLGMILHNSSQPFDADVLEVMTIRPDESADGCGRGVQENQVGVDGRDCLDHFIDYRIIE